MKEIIVWVVVIILTVSLYCLACYVIAAQIR